MVVVLRWGEEVKEEEHMCTLLCRRKEKRKCLPCIAEEVEEQKMVFVIHLIPPKFLLEAVTSESDSGKSGPGPGMTESPAILQKWQPE